MGALSQTVVASKYRLIRCKISDDRGAVQGGLHDERMLHLKRKESKEGCCVDPSRRTLACPLCPACPILQPVGSDALNGTTPSDLRLSRSLTDEFVEMILYGFSELSRWCLPSFHLDIQP